MLKADKPIIAHNKEIQQQNAVHGITIAWHGVRRNGRPDVVVDDSGHQQQHQHQHQQKQHNDDDLIVVSEEREEGIFAFDDEHHQNQQQPEQQLSPEELKARAAKKKLKKLRQKEKKERQKGKQLRFCLELNKTKEYCPNTEIWTRFVHDPEKQPARGIMKKESLISWSSKDGSPLSSSPSSSVSPSISFDDASPFGGKNVHKKNATAAVPITNNQRSSSSGKKHKKRKATATCGSPPAVAMTTTACLLMVGL
eukprot:GEZU01039003.1.p1 GENE.GEZU01039003.1~~GEZU01039003.1.p1  ORF type:complete len:253 (-),score=85.32 GEZU01039003.1:59-817(-)